MTCNQWLNLPNSFVVPLNEQIRCRHQTHFLFKGAKKLRSMILHDHEIIRAKIRCCTAGTKLQRGIFHRSFRPFHGKPKKMIILISLNRCGTVGVGLGALGTESEGWKWTKFQKEISLSRSIYNWVSCDFGDQNRDGMVQTGQTNKWRFNDTCSMFTQLYS